MHFGFSKKNYLKKNWNENKLCTLFRGNMFGKQSNMFNNMDDRLGEQDFITLFNKYDSGGERLFMVISHTTTLI